jgi:hypothetical protein
MAPSNFLALNADALNKVVETKGESLAQGIANLLADMRQGHVSMTDESLFTVGKNVATTEGAVVFENELFQLIEYKPLTAKVFEKPFLMVPPCINKFYILDLQPDNSVIRYAVSQGIAPLWSVGAIPTKARPQELGRLHRRWRTQGSEHGSGYLRGAADQCAGFLRGRHHALHCHGSAGRTPCPRAWTAAAAKPAAALRQQRQAAKLLRPEGPCFSRRQHDAADHADRLSRHRHSGHLHR